MRIGLLRRRYLSWGGGERFAHDFLELLASTGHEVHLFCQEWRRTPSAATVHRVPRVGTGAIDVLTYAVLAPYLARAAGVDVVHSFERTLSQDIFRAGEGCHREWLAVRASAHRGVLGDVGVRPFHHAVLLVERSIARRRAAKVVQVNSRMVEADFRRRYGELRSQVALVRNGVDTDRFNPQARAARRESARGRLGLPAERLVLLAVGSGFERKGLPVLVRALARVRGPRPLLLVVGKGRPQGVAALSCAAGVGDAVCCLGEVHDVTEVYAAADVFVLPTLYDPASNATLEALATGIPVITTARNGSSEILEHGTSGFILDRADDADGLARLLDAARDPRVRRTVGEAGRRAVEPWTRERCLDETLALYRCLP